MGATSVRIQDQITQLKASVVPLLSDATKNGLVIVNADGSAIGGGGTVGPGTINELAYFDTTTTVDSLPVATYPSLAELAYVKGVTSAIQTQINGKQASMGADDNYVTDAQLAALHGVNDANTTSNSYADGKVDDTVYGIGRDTDTTHAPSKNAVYDKIQTIIAAGLGYYTTSATNITFGLGVQVFTIVTGLAYSPGQQLIISKVGAPTEYEIVTVLDYTTTSLTVDSTRFTGVGSNSSRDINLIGFDGQVSDTAYDATTRDNVTTIAPSKNAIRDKIETLAPLVSPSFTTPALGTPSSGTLTSCTGLPIAGLTASTSTALGVGSIELGHATDTSITRVSAGVAAIEGQTIATASNTLTLTNKRIDPRKTETTSYTTDTGTSLDVSTTDIFVITAQAGALKFNNPGGTPVAGNKLIVRIKDNGTARALTYDTQFRAMGNALPSTTVLSKTLYMGFMYNGTDTKRDLVAVAQEA